MSIVNKKVDFWLKLSTQDKPILALAPMAGISDSAFRQICREQGADVVYTEMISADGLYHDSKKTLEFLRFNKKEKPVVAQMFGKQPEKFAKAARLCQEAGLDGIDINFGCPAKKVVAHGGGVTLMRDLPKCREIIEATLSGTKLPVSVKVRSSIGKITALDFIRAMQGLPLSAVMVHGRPYETPFSGEIDYKMISAVKKEFKGIVLANGGIKTPEDAQKMLGLTNADGVGLARGLYGRPYLFAQIKKFWRSGKYSQPSQKEIIKIILRHAQLAEKAKGEYGLVELRKHLLWYVAGWPNAKDLRSQLVRVENIKQLKEILRVMC